MISYFKKMGDDKGLWIVPLVIVLIFAVFAFFHEPAELEASQINFGQAVKIDEFGNYNLWQRELNYRGDKMLILEYRVTRGNSFDIESRGLRIVVIDDD